MSSLPERRRADRFAELLDQAERGRRPHRRSDEDAELVPLTDFARSLRETAAPTPSDDLRVGRRAMLMAKIEREGLGLTASDDTQEVPSRSALDSSTTQVIHKVPARAGNRARVAVLIGIISGVLASGVSLASTDSAPGDALYPVKRTSEQAQLVLAGSDASRGRLHLEFAKSRLVEARLVAPDAVTTTLAAMDDETRAGVSLLFTNALNSNDAAAIDDVMTFLAQQRAQIDETRALAPVATDRLRASLDLLADIETRANLVRAALLGGCNTTNTDTLGPRPEC